MTKMRQRLPAGENGDAIKDRPRSPGDAAAHPAVRAIAFYLPQFHPIPENDSWWGKGFTDWTNVEKVTPRFRGHEQPHRPSDLGYYDLRLPEVREAQAELAKRYGLAGFCYYHYWFEGRRILERPFDDVLASGRPDFPFCLCWANENWTRRWDGQDGEVLLRQTYSADDDRRHLGALAPAFRDARYIRIHGKPLLLVYRASALPHAHATTDVWRETARGLGVGDIYLCNVESFPSDHGLTSSSGFDASVEFAPDWSELGRPVGRGVRARIAARLGLGERQYLENRMSEYADLMKNMLAKPAPAYLRFPCVTPSWDNSARRQTGATILRGATPDLYEQWLRTVVNRFRAPTADERIVFINAWNEWAEGSHLEPCQRWGHGYLEATRRALRPAHA